MAQKQSARCNAVGLLVASFNNSNNLLGLYFHANKIDPNPCHFNRPNRNNPNNLLDTITFILGYIVTSVDQFERKYTITF